MNASTTRWLWLLALLLGGFILFYEGRRPSSRERDKAGELALPGLAPGAVTSVEIQRGTNFFLRLERTNNTWRITAPFAYAAQAGGVQQLLERLAQLPARSTLSAAEVVAVTNGPTAFGLEEPAAVITVQSGNRRDQLRLGSASVLGDQIYAQVVGREGLITLDSRSLAALPATVNQWRDPGLLAVGDLKPDHLEIRPSTDGFEIVQDPTNQTWQLTRPLSTLASGARIAALLQQVDLARVSQFVAEGATADLEPLGLQPPLREIAFFRGTNEVAALQIGKSPTNDPAQIYVRRLPSSNVVLVARAVIAPWLGSFRDFCDRRLLVFRLEAVDRIEVGGSQPFAVQRGGATDWQIVAPYRAPADGVLVLEMLAELATLQYIEFEREAVSDFAPYGLQPPRREYALLGSVTNAAGTVTNHVLARVAMGNPKDTRVLARRNQESSVLTFYDAERLPRAAFELRDRQIWNFSTNQITGVTVEQGGETRHLTRAPSGQWSLAGGGSGTVSSLTLEEAVYRLAHLRAHRWVAEGADELARFGFGTVDHRVTLETRTGEQAGQHTIRFGRRGPSGRTYAAVDLPGSPGPVVFECPAEISAFVRTDLSRLPAGP